MSLSKIRIVIKELINSSDEVGLYGYIKKKVIDENDITIESLLGCIKSLSSDHWRRDRHCDNTDRHCDNTDRHCGYTSSDNSDNSDGHDANENMLYSITLNIIINSKAELTEEEYISKLADFLACVIRDKSIVMVERVFDKCQLDSRKLVNYLCSDNNFDETTFEWICTYPSLMPDDVTWLLINACDTKYSKGNIEKLLHVYQPNGSEYDTDMLISTAIRHDTIWVLDYLLNKYQLPIKTRHVLLAIKINKLELIEIFIKNGWNPDIKLSDVVPGQSGILLPALAKLKEDYNLDPFVMLMGLLTMHGHNIDKLFKLI